MKKPVAKDHFTSRSHRVVNLLCYLLIIVFTLRRSYDLQDGFTFTQVLLFSGLFTALYASEPFISRRIKSYPRFYFAAQLILVLWLGIFHKYQDTWSGFFIILGFQVAVRCPRKEAMAWFGLFVTVLLATLSFEFGLVSGPGRALAYTVIGALLISYDSQYAQHEDTLSESQMLVAELQEANKKMAEYTDQAEKLATLQERNRMVKELYDAVGQKVFAIQLTAETTRLMLEKDPGRAMEQIDDLQEQTQSVLAQMRELIEQWQPE